MARKREWLGYYILQGKLAVPCKDVMKWAEWFETADRRVALDRIGGIEISTIFIGLDHNFVGFWGKAVHIFETMIFRGGESSDTFRCGSWEEAEAQHAKAVAMVRAEIKDKVNE